MSSLAEGLPDGLYSVKKWIAFRPRVDALSSIAVARIRHLTGAGAAPQLDCPILRLKAASLDSARTDLPSGATPVRFWATSFLVRPQHATPLQPGAKNHLPAPPAFRLVPIAGRQVFESAHLLAFSYLIPPSSFPLGRGKRGIVSTHVTTISF
jgi:hypothetical protein